MNTSSWTAEVPARRDVLSLPSLLARRRPAVHFGSHFSIESDVQQRSRRRRCASMICPTRSVLGHAFSLTWQRRIASFRHPLEVSRERTSASSISIVPSSSRQAPAGGRWPGLHIGVCFHSFWSRNRAWNKLGPRCVCVLNEHRFLSAPLLPAVATLSRSISTGKGRGGASVTVRGAWRVIPR